MHACMCVCMYVCREARYIVYPVWLCVYVCLWHVSMYGEYSRVGRLAGGVVGSGCGSIGARCVVARYICAR